jgi:predicted kinase
VARLIHLNGPPGIGKSTLARRYVDLHPGVMNCDVDVLRTLIGGWQQDFGGAGALIRPAALALISAYLGNGHDVVLPQMLVRPTELAKFRDAAIRSGADYIHCMLFDAREESVARFHRRVIVDELQEGIRATVAAEGGDAELARLHDALVALTAEIDGTIVVNSIENDVDDTYRALLHALEHRA